MVRMLVTGARGLLGGACLAVAAADGHAVTAVVRPGARPAAGRWDVLEADLAAPGAAGRVLEAVQPQAVLHCAAMAAPAACQQDPPAAWRINAAVVEELVAAAAAGQIRLIHVSTDLVFDGTRGLLDERALPRPRSVYGQTKAAADAAVLGSSGNACVVRPSLLLGDGPRTPDGALRRALLAGQRPGLFVDEWRTPAFATDVAACMVALATHPFRGLLNVAGPRHLTRYNLGVGLAHLWGLDPGLVRPVRLRNVPMVPPRCADTRLRTATLRQLAPALPLPRAVLQSPADRVQRR